MKQSLISTYTTHITAVSACLRTVTKVEENYDILVGSFRRGCLNPSCKRLAVLHRLRINRALRSRSVHRASYTDFQQRLYFIELHALKAKITWFSIMVDHMYYQ